jgi:hypothetical protein
VDRVDYSEMFRAKISAAQDVQLAHELESVKRQQGLEFAVQVVGDNLESALRDVAGEFRDFKFQATHQKFLGPILSRVYSYSFNGIPVVSGYIRVHQEDPGSPAVKISTEVQDDEITATGGTLGSIVVDFMEKFLTSLAPYYCSSEVKV